MPLYEFQCRRCEHITEEFQKLMEQKSLRTCEECGDTAAKVVSAPNIQDDHPSWIDQKLRNQIQDDSEPPIESRTQLKKAEREKGIVENPKS